MEVPRSAEYLRTLKCNIKQGGFGTYYQPCPALHLTKGLLEAGKMQCSVASDVSFRSSSSVHLPRSNHWCANPGFVCGWRCSCREGLAACCLAARISGCHKRKLLCQRPIGPRQNDIVIGRDQEASERKMCKSNVVDQVRLVYRVRFLLPLKRIL